MSIRSLIEINHDRCGTMSLADREAFLEALDAYVASGSQRTAEPLERFGLRVVGMRHHSNNYVIDGKAEGFPAQYLGGGK